MGDRGRTIKITITPGDHGSYSLHYEDANKQKMPRGSHGEITFTNGIGLIKVTGSTIIYDIEKSAPGPVTAAEQIMIDKRAALDIKSKKNNR